MDKRHLREQGGEEEKLVIHASQLNPSQIVILDQKCYIIYYTLKEEWNKSMINEKESYMTLNIILE